MRLPIPTTTLLRPAALCLLAGLALQASAQTQAALPADLASWQCTGLCGASAAQGDITLSPAGSAAYGFVSTAGSAAEGVSPLALDHNQGLGETNGSRLLSPAFSAAAGQLLSLQFNYVSTDGKGFDDYAWARVVQADAPGSTVAWLFTARSSNSGTHNIVPGDVLPRDDFDPRTVIVNYDSFEFTSKTADDPVNWLPLGDSNRTCWRDNAAGCGFTGWLNAQHSLAATGSYRLELGVVNWNDQAYDSGLAVDFSGLVATPVPEVAPMLPKTMVTMFTAVPRSSGMPAALR